MTGIVVLALLFFPMDQFSSYLVTGGTSSSTLLLIYVFVGLAMVFSLSSGPSTRASGSRPPISTTATPWPIYAHEDAGSPLRPRPGPGRRTTGTTTVLDEILRSVGVYRLYESSLNSQIERGRFPATLGLSWTGTGGGRRTTASAIDLGHTQGADVVERLLDWCHEIGIKSITLYVLSTENLLRSSEEVAELYRLISRGSSGLLTDERIYKYKVRVKGDREVRPPPRPR